MEDLRVLTTVARFCGSLYDVSGPKMRRSGKQSDFTSGAWFTFFLRCRPMAAFWDPRLGGTCYSMQLFKSFAMANTGENKEHVFEIEK
jgi:hypothetical protein